jgi:hypothetical protein
VTYVKDIKDCDAYPKTCELYDKENKKLDKCPSKFCILVYYILYVYYG